MISLKKAVLPSTIEVDGIFYAIKTDFQYFLIFQELLKKDKVMLKEFDYLYEVEIPEDRQKGLDELIRFAFPKRELPRKINNEQSNEIIFDYNIDADLIFSAFWEKYKIDLCDEKLHLHWYKFQALFFGLKDTLFNSIMEYRSFVPKGKMDEHQKNMLKQKKAWRIEEALTEEEQKMVDEFERIAGGN